MCAALVGERGSALARGKSLGTTLIAGSENYQWDGVGTRGCCRTSEIANFTEK